MAIIGESSQRQLRVAEAIKRVLVDYLYKEGLIDFNLEEGSIPLPPITITQVQVSGDLQHALVFVMPLGGENQDRAIELLNKSERRLRGYLGHHLKTRFTPTLKFEIDTSFNKAKRIETILQKMEQSDSSI